MEKEKLISIVVPVYNCEKTVKRTIKSIITQLDEDSELIVINDGSIDNSLDVLHKIAGNINNVKIIDSINHGAMLARKFGTEESKGKYIWYVDGGDEILPNSIELIKETIKKESNVDILYINHQTVSGKVIKQHRENYKTICNPNNILLGTLPLALWTRIIKKELLLNLKAYDIKEKMTLLEDGIVSLEACLKANKVALVNQCCYQYNLESNSQSTSNTGIDSLIIGIKHIYNFVNEYYPCYKEEVNYFVFNNTINRIIFGKNKNNKLLYDFYCSILPISSKYIKMKSICELIAKWKARHE